MFCRHLMRQLPNHWTILQGLEQEERAASVFQIWHKACYSVISSKRRRNMLRGWQSTLLSLTTAALMSGGVARADEPIKIGFAIAQSGFMSAYDTPGFKAAVLKIEEINAAGGLLGRKIEYSV